MSAPVVADVVASGAVKGGKLYLHNRRAFDQQIAQMREGWQLEVYVTRRRATRSLQQNAFYWGVVMQLLSDHTGYTPDEMHEVCKAKFIPRHLAVSKGNGEIVGEFVLGGSTRSLNKNEFSEYVERVRQWAAEDLDVYIPDPNEGAL